MSGYEDDEERWCEKRIRWFLGSHHPSWYGAGTIQYWKVQAGNATTIHDDLYCTVTHIPEKRCQMWHGMVLNFWPWRDEGASHSRQNMCRSHRLTQSVNFNQKDKISLEYYRTNFRRNCYKVLQGVTCCYKTLTLYIVQEYDTSPLNIRNFLSLHGPSQPYTPLQEMYTLTHSEKSFFPRNKLKSSQNLQFRRNSSALCYLSQWTIFPPHCSRRSVTPPCWQRRLWILGSQSTEFTILHVNRQVDGPSVLYSTYNKRKIQPEHSVMIIWYVKLTSTL